MKLKFALLLAIISTNVFAQSLKHSFDEGVIKARVIKTGGYSTLKKTKNHYQYTVFNKDGHLKFDYQLPWQPTHQSYANASSKTFIGSLKRNGHNGKGELIIFDQNGVVQSLSNIVHFDVISDDGSFYIIKDTNDKHELTLFDANMAKINGKKFNKNFDNHSLLSIAPSGNRLSLSAVSPDMSSRQTVKTFHGDGYNEFFEWNFNGAPIYQVNQLSDGVTTLNVNHKLFAFKANQKIWAFPDQSKKFKVDTVLPAQSGQYILVRNNDKPADFVVLRQDGKIVFESVASEALQYLANGNGYGYHIIGDSLIIDHTEQKIADIISLTSGKRKKKLDLDDDKILDINGDYALILSKGKIKKIKL